MRKASRRDVLLQPSIIHDRMSAPVSVSLGGAAGFLVFTSRSKILGVVTIKKKTNKNNLLEGESERGHENGCGGKHQNAVPCWEYDSGSGGANGKTSSPTVVCVCVCQFMF